MTLTPDVLPDPDDPPLDLAWPLRTITLPDGSEDFATVEQGSDEEIRGGLALACEVRVDQLPWAPELGIPDPLGSTDPEATAMEIETALGEIDPREPVEVTVLDSAIGRSLLLRVGTAPSPDDDVVVTFDA